MKFDQASNAIVGVVGFYADAVGTLQTVLETQSKQLLEQMKKLGDQAAQLAELRVRDRAAGDAIASLRALGSNIQSLLVEGADVKVADVLEAFAKPLEVYDRAVDRVAPAVRPPHPGTVPPADV